MKVLVFRVGNDTQILDVSTMEKGVEAYRKIFKALEDLRVFRYLDLGSGLLHLFGDDFKREWKETLAFGTYDDVTLLESNVRPILEMVAKVRVNAPLIEQYQLAKTGNVFAMQDVVLNAGKAYIEFTEVLDPRKMGRKEKSNEPEKAS